MAFDFGSKTLGIKNPFKAEGLAISIAGLAICLMAVPEFLSVKDLLEQDAVRAWAAAITGFILMAMGLRHSGLGLFQLFKYFVGRSVPTSLAPNLNPSERENAAQEQSIVNYKASDLESMLMGRKNSTFAEPKGWLARLVHTLIPRLLFMPHRLRNVTQEMFGMVASVVTTLVAFGIAYFVASSGLAGDAGELITPILSIVLLLSLVLSWRGAAKRANQVSQRGVRSKSAGNLAFLFSLAFVVPVLIGYGYAQLDSRAQSSIQGVAAYLNEFNAFANLLLLFVVALVVLGLFLVLLVNRLKLAATTTEVSEYRDNLQESVHPREIFINIENIILANRRYKEIPNRIYQELEPSLEEQSEGKGNFKGQLLIETQPALKEMKWPSSFNLVRLIATYLGQALVVTTAALFVYLVGTGLDVWSFVSSTINSRQTPDMIVWSEGIASLLFAFFAWQTLSAGSRMLSSSVHLFWAEIQFDSLLMWMKTEGTYTESKISTGMGIHDSTRSENTVVKSSITPWIITSRITSSIYATSGNNNLELSRIILDMNKNDQELDGIKDELYQFLRGRESLATINNDADIKTATDFNQVNVAARAPELAANKKLTEEVKSQDEQAAYKRLSEEGAN